MNYIRRLLGQMVVKSSVRSMKKCPSSRPSRLGSFEPEICTKRRSPLGTGYSADHGRANADAGALHSKLIES
jgi:hypothetical protein